MKFLLSANADNLRKAIAGVASATVEAEYGDDCVEGSVITMAHHGPRAGQPAPCSYPNLPQGNGVKIEVVGLSHLDLDSIGGCMALLNQKPDAEDFWNLAEFVDLNGAHKLGEADASEEDLASLYAFWAWDRDHKVFPDREGGVTDVTAEVTAAINIVKVILDGDAKLLEAGQAFKEAEAELNKNSFVRTIDCGKYRMIVRHAEVPEDKADDENASGGFTNHMYITPDGEVCDAVIALRDGFDSITLSTANTIEGFSCCSAVQALWGPKAGGHQGIAGSDREVKMGSDDLKAAAGAVGIRLRNSIVRRKDEETKKPSIMGGRRKR